MVRKSKNDEGAEQSALRSLTNLTESEKYKAIKKIAASVKNSDVLSDRDIDRGYIDTMNLALNYIISGRWYDGGVPMGRVTEIYGSSATCKTALATHILSACQTAGGITGLLDSENAYNVGFAKRLGLSPEQLIYATPHTLEESFDTIHRWVEGFGADSSLKDLPIIIVYDSIAASPSKKEYEEVVVKKDENTAEMGLRARIASQRLRILQSFLMDHNVAVVVLNQMRQKTGIVYGPSETTAGGGNALPYYGSIRMHLKRRKKIELPGIKKPQGIYLAAIIEKNKVSDPFLEAEEIEFFFEFGLNPLSGVISAGTFTGDIIQPKVGWYAFKKRPDKTFRRKDLDEFILKDDNYVLLDAPSREALEKYISRGKEAVEASESGAYTVIDADDDDESPVIKASSRVGPPKFVETGSDDDR